MHLRWSYIYSTNQDGTTASSDKRERQLRCRLNRQQRWRQNQRRPTTRLAFPSHRANSSSFIRGMMPAPSPLPPPTPCMLKVFPLPVCP